MLKLSVERVCSDEFQVAFRNLSAILFPSFDTNLSIARTLKIIAEARECYGKTRNALLERFGTKTSVTGEFHIKPADIQAFQAELSKAGKGEIDILASNIDLPMGALLTGRDLCALEGVLRLKLPETNQTAETDSKPTAG